MYSAAEPVLFKASGSWADVERRLGGIFRARVLFAAIYIALLAMDHQLRGMPGEPALLKPSVGVLLMVLWLSRPAAWPVFLAIHCIAALLVGWLLHDSFSLWHTLHDIVPGAIAGFVGALACLALIRGPLRLHVRLVPLIIWGIAIGSLAGAASAVALDYGLGPESLAVWNRATIHWGGLMVGALTTGPLVLLWSRARPSAHPELVLRSRRQLVAMIAAAVAGVLLVFWWARNFGSGSLLPLPVVIGALLIYVCFYLPPRWVSSLVVLTNLLCAALWVLRREPFVFADPLIRVGLFQVLLGIFAVIPFILSIAVSQMRITLWNLGESEHRYRSFVQLSHEAVWRLEVDPPMPLDLPLAEQRAWMHRHARMVESNLSYDRVAPERSNGAGPVSWSDIPWGAELERRLEELAADEHCIEDVRFTVRHQGRARTYLASFSPVLESGCVRRLWGVARDVTDLVDLNAQLQREQERLRDYARLLMAAEEKARRATAIDLHDGIGQTLVGMQMMLEAARDHSTDETRALFDEIHARLREVHDTTRRVISDLSPPGLYDLGLVPALQWLAVFLRTHDGLQVELECHLREERVTLTMRVLVFKLVRELLRNVIKHAGVLVARVEVEEADDMLRVSVSDQGRGFEWHPDASGARTDGFGLWSIADRVREAGGTFRVESAVGQGARFEMRLPMQAQGNAPERRYA